MLLSGTSMTPTTGQLNYRLCSRNVAVWQAPAATRAVRCQAAASSQTEAVRAGDLMGIVPWAVKNGVQVRTMCILLLYIAIQMAIEAGKAVLAGHMRYASVEGRTGTITGSA
jgi:hypothetical protein